MTAHSIQLQALADANAKNGPRTPHALEFFGVGAFFVLCAGLVYRLAMAPTMGSGWAIAAALVVGYIGADLTSGLVHWLFDTWGSPETPVVGANFITPFRIHHVDPKDITRHGFIATNGHNCLVSLVVLGPAFLVPLGTVWGQALLTLLLALCLGVFGTNQFHKWAHEDAVGPVVGWLQRAGLILGPAHHDIHHRAPYEHHYCITSGWLNGILRQVGFFRGLERVIHAVTGAEPRKDDLRTTGAGR